MQPTLCSKCKKNVAVVFISRMNEKGEPVNEGLCLKCAAQLGLPQVEDMMKRMGITPDDLENLNSEMMQAFGAPVVFTALGRGTASDEVLSYLGLEATEKSVMLSVVTPTCKEVLMKELVTTMHLTNPGTGIAMCLPLSSIGGRTAMNYLITGNPEAEPDVEVKEDESMKDAAYQLIVAIANQGYTDTVMGAARSAGAHGGTILHAKSTGAEDAGKFFGMSIAEEREIILMVVPTGDKNTVMQAIMAQAGAHTEAQAVTFSVALEDVAGLYHINTDE